MKQKVNKHSYRVRTQVMFGVVLAIFIYATCYIVYWQFFRGEEFSTYVSNQSLWTTELTSERGTIYDTNGEVLAQSASVWSVVLEPLSISSSSSVNRTDEETKQLIATELARILDMDKDTILAMTEQNSYFVYVERKVEDSIKDEITEFMTNYGISDGIRFITEYKRYYPYGDVASTVIGFTGTDGSGLLGVELQYDTELTGTTGQLVSAKNSLGGDMPFEYEQFVGAEDGYDLVLTIDVNIQSILEQYLAEGIEKYGVAEGATAIVMDVNTGAILGLATGDTFDLNDPFTIASEETQAEIDALPEDEQSAAYTTALYDQWRNKAVSDTYEPGSVFKMVTAAAALDSGSITTDTTFSCTGSYVVATGVNPIGCWYSYGHGIQTVTDGLCNSCNPFFMQVISVMGGSIFYDYFEAFGFTTTTGIDLPGEANSIYTSEENATVTDLATASFGQGFTVTPIQMITAVCAIANGGYLVTPYVVEKMIDSDGNVVETTSETVVRQVVSEEITDIVTDALTLNVSEGSASTGAVPGYSIAGKTGTSEKISKYWSEYYATGEYQDMQYIASFCGYAPSDDPQYALLVYFDEPDREIASGAQQAGPIFASIMSEILPYLGVDSNLDEDEYITTVTTAPDVVGMTVEEAKELINSEGLTWTVYDGDDYYSSDSSEYSETAIVQIQTPTKNTEMPDGGEVVISIVDSISSDDMTVVPDFYGLSITECYALAKEYDIQVVLTGSTTDGTIKAQTQSEVAGKSVRKGTVITVTVAKFSGVE